MCTMVLIHMKYGIYKNLLTKIPQIKKSTITVLSYGYEINKI